MINMGESAWPGAAIYVVAQSLRREKQLNPVEERLCARDALAMIPGS